MKLTNYIIEHIFLNLGMLSSKHNSIFTSSLIITPTLTFEENNQEQQYSIYACQSNIHQSKMLIAATNIKSETSQELYAIIELKDSPTYGCYLSLQDQQIDKGIMAFYIKETWLATNVFIQASFLAGMEQLRDLGASFAICSDPQAAHQKLSSFIKYCDQINER